jgi:hypothetical protein
VVHVVKSPAAHRRPGDHPSLVPRDALDDAADRDHGSRPRSGTGRAIQIDRAVKEGLDSAIDGADGHRVRSGGEQRGQDGRAVGVVRGAALMAESAADRDAVE